VDHTNFGPKTADEISGSLYKRPNFDYLFHPVTLVGSRRAYGALKGQLCGIDTNSTTTALKGYSLSVCSTQIAKCFFSSLTVCCDTQMWIRPNGVSQVMTNILHKGSSEIERSPSIFFYPGSTRYAICSSRKTLLELQFRWLPRLHIRSSTTRYFNFGKDPSRPLRNRQWTHVIVTHSNTGLEVRLGLFETRNSCLMVCLITGVLQQPSGGTGCHRSSQDQQWYSGRLQRQCISYRHALCLV